MSNAYYIKYHPREGGDPARGASRIYKGDCKAVADQTPAFAGVVYLYGSAS